MENFSPAKVSLADQIKAIESVVMLRRKTNGSMFGLLGDALGEAAAAAVKSRIYAENAALEAALKTLRRLEWRKHWSQACSDDCGHTEAEHVAFVLGVAAGELGFEEESCPYGDGGLREDWLAGYSAGSLNGENGNESTANSGD